MEPKHCLINKYASILYRLAQPFFDRELAPYRIGCGQQFFLLRIHAQPGVSMLELAAKGHFDKGTTNRAVRKLTELGYVSVVADKQDKRVRRLYGTEAAEPVVKAIIAALEKWNEIVTGGLGEEERVRTERVLEQMTENAYAYVRKYKGE